MILFDLEIKIEFLLISYLGTRCIYLYNFYKEIDYDKLNNHCRTSHLKIFGRHLPMIVFFYGLGYFILLIISASIETIIFGFIFLSLGILFTIKGKIISKRIIGFKTLYTSLSWSILVPFTLIYCSQMKINFQIMLFVIFVFIRWIINTSFFDIKDMESDEKRKLKTIAIKLGRNNFLDFLQIINIVSIFPIIIGIFIFNLPVYSFFLTLTFFYTFYYICKARNNDIDITKLSHVIVDGEYFVWPFMLLFGLIIFG